MPQIPPRHLEEIRNSKRSKILLLPTAVFYLLLCFLCQQDQPQEFFFSKGLPGKTNTLHKAKVLPSKHFGHLHSGETERGKKSSTRWKTLSYNQPPNITPFSWCHATDFSYLWIFSTDLWIQGMPVTCQHDTTTTVHIALKQFSNLHQVLLWTDCFVYAWSLSL